MEIVRRTDLLGAGQAAHEVRRDLRTGRLTPIRRGVYTGQALPAGAADRHALQARATVADLADDAVLSHVSAAVLHGLPTWAIPLDRVHATRPRRTGGRRGRLTHVHTAQLDRDEVVDIDGIAVTGPARTVVDVARTAGFEPAVVLADRALHAGLVAPEQLADALDRAAHRSGVAAARRAVAFADRRSEGVGESRSRVAIAAAGLPAPVLQWDVRSADGTWLGRTDFGWPDRRTIGEFDGRVKYGKLVRPGQTPGDVVFAEKRREDALRDADYRIVRWIWSDLDDFAPVAARLRRLLT